jgi:hypothetical protein
MATSGGLPRRIVKVRKRNNIRICWVCSTYSVAFLEKDRPLVHFGPIRDFFTQEEFLRFGFLLVTLMKQFG